MRSLKTNRRGFLGLLGVGAASAPLAAKAALDTEIAKQVGLNTTSFVGSASFTGPPSSLDSHSLPYEETVQRSSQYLKLMGIPKDLERELRNRAQYIHALDPDLAAKKTWSMSVKLMTQRERNYQRQIDSIHETALYHNLRKRLASILGFSWPF